MMMIEEVRRFFRRLKHGKYGVTELVALDKYTGKPVATGFFDEEDRLVSCCRIYNERCNVYAGRNPRPISLPDTLNVMDTVGKKRARDRDIRYLTAISLDIDPIRDKELPSTPEQHQAAVSFALNLQWDLGGDVDDSGNGAYLWIPFRTPIEITPDNRDTLKPQFRIWQEGLKGKYRPEDYGLRIDGCYDFSRIKRVIGTVNHKAQRVSQSVHRSEPGDTVRDRIVSIQIEKPTKSRALPSFAPLSKLPDDFQCLMRWDPEIQALWQKGDPDRSKHDWMLGLTCLDAGFTQPEELAAILMRNPHGKYQRDRRMGYILTTVGRLVEKGRKRDDGVSQGEE